MNKNTPKFHKNLIKTTKNHRKNLKIIYNNLKTQNKKIHLRKISILLITKNPKGKDTEILTKKTNLKRISTHISNSNKKKK